MFVACVVLIILHAVVVYQSLLCIRRGQPTDWKD